MANNAPITPGAGLDVATDEIGGVHHQRVKVEFGAEGEATDVSSADPLPVAGPVTDAELRATPVPVSGPITDDELRASAVPVETELTTADLDTGAGSDPRAVVGLARAESGGAVLVGSANPLPISGAVVEANSAGIQADLDAIIPDVEEMRVDLDAIAADVDSLGAKTDAKNSATDGTSVSIVALLKQISYQLQQEQPTILNKFVSVKDTVTVGGTVETVDLDTSAFTKVSEISVVNMDGTDDFEITVGTSGSPPPDPNGTNSEHVPGSGVPSTVTFPNNVVGTIRVKIKCATGGAQFAVIARGT